MSEVAQDLVINVVGGVMAAPILFAFGRMVAASRASGAALPPGEAAVTIGAVGRPTRWARLALAGGFALVALAVDLYRPPPPLIPLFYGNVALTDPDYLVGRAESERRNAENDARNLILDAERDAELVMLRAA